MNNHNIGDESTAGITAAQAPRPRPAARGGLWSGVIQSMRPAQWAKNSFVFAAIIFSGHLFEREAQLHTLLAFAALCMCASGAYLFNDIRDREQDRNHPTKRLRPIAAGVVPVGAALGLALGLVATGLAVASSVNTKTGFAVAAYVALTFSYSLLLKNIVIVDVLALAAGFVLRVIVGAEAIAVEFSSWLVLCTFLLALFLALGKRRHELVLLESNAQSHRPILGEYSPHFLDMMIAVVTAGTMMSYVLYTMDATTLARFHGNKPIYTSVFVLYGIFRYLYLIHQRRSGGNPTQIMYTDRGIQIAALLWAASVVALRYA